MKPDFLLKQLISMDPKQVLGKTLSLCGWLRSARHQKTFSFLALNDGTMMDNFQVIADESTEGYQEFLSELQTGASIHVVGEIVESPGKGQSIELKAQKIQLIGACPQDYPLQKKRHSFEFLRSIAHLRVRTNTQGAVARVRSKLAYATHKYFQENDFVYLQSPVITAADCEGAGELFQVTTLPLDNVPLDDHNKVDFKQDFFGKSTYLTVSGQLNAETYALGLSKTYTFGPTFRAENSNTSRHIAEFWMIEPEVAFFDLKDNMDLAEDYLKFILKEVLNQCSQDLQFFDKFIEKGLIQRLEAVVNSSFARMTYSEAIDLLLKSNKKFEYEVRWGCDLQSEHERFIAEEHCKRPVILTDYPKEIKAFYMRDNEDGKTVSAMDILVPNIGELIGGAQREERYDVLEKKIQNLGMPLENYSWYLDLRKYGSVPHSGFGVGFERLVQFVTGIENIRDAIAFPRAPKTAEF